jgi:hypothetical protein
MDAHLNQGLICTLIHPDTQRFSNAFSIHARNADGPTYQGVDSGTLLFINGTFLSYTPTQMQHQFLNSMSEQGAQDSSRHRTDDMIH